MALAIMFLCLGCGEGRWGAVWQVSTPAGETARVECFLYQQSTEAENVFTNRLAFFSSQIQSLEEAARKTTNAKMRAAMEEERSLYRDGMNFTGAWPSWPMVALWILPDESGPPMRFAALCRSAKRQTDIIFLLTASKELSSYTSVVGMVRILTRKVDDMDDRQWSSLPKRNVPLFDKQGNVVDEAVLKSVGPLPFLEQH